MFKFEIGRKFESSDFGRPGFFRRGEMSASLNFDGKVAWVNERFARCDMMMEKVSAQDFTSEYFGSHDWSAALASCTSRNTIQVATHGGKLHRWSGILLPSGTVHPGVVSSVAPAFSFCRPAPPHDTKMSRCYSTEMQFLSGRPIGLKSAWPTTLREAAVQLPRGSFKKDLKTHLFREVV